MRKRVILSYGFILIFFVTALPVESSLALLCKNHVFRQPRLVSIGNGDIIRTQRIIPSPPLPYPQKVLPFNLDMIDIDNITNQGDGVYVAVLDTGLGEIWPQLFVREQIVVEWGKRFTYESVKWDYKVGDFVPAGHKIEDNYFVTDPWGSGHGTIVTSVITGYNVGGVYYTRQILGVAPKARIIPVQVIDTWIVEDVPDEVKEENPAHPYYTFGFEDMVAAGIDYIAHLAKKERIKVVINLSIGDVTASKVIQHAINRAVKKGVIVVASAGNRGYDGMTWPGAYPQVISAGAVGWTLEFYGHEGLPGNPDYWSEDVPENLYTRDVIGNGFQVYLATFSSRPNPELKQYWQSLDISTPGAAVLGPYMIEGTGEWAYYAVWGTSLSAPHVAGIAALILQNYPWLKQRQMEIVLRAAASLQPLPERGKSGSAIVYSIFNQTLIQVTWGPWDYGLGLLQADAALTVADYLFGEQTHNIRLKP